MRVEFINKLTGSIMLVDESKIEEYKAIGHTMAVPTDDVEKKPGNTRKRKNKSTNED